MRSIRSSAAALVAIVALALASFSFAGPTLAPLGAPAPPTIESLRTIQLELNYAEQHRAEVRALEARAAQVQAEIREIESLLESEPIDNSAIWCDANRAPGPSSTDSYRRAYLLRESTFCMADWNAAPNRGERRPASLLQI